MNHIIEVDHLMKSYGTVKAVQDISFYVEEGGLFAFLGPNGAGKSTTINMKMCIRDSVRSDPYRRLCSESLALLLPDNPSCF